MRYAEAGCQTIPGENDESQLGQHKLTVIYWDDQHTSRAFTLTVRQQCSRSAGLRQWGLGTTRSRCRKRIIGIIKYVAKYKMDNMSYLLPAIINKQLRPTITTVSNNLTMASAVTETAPTVVPIVEDKITLTGLAREPIKSNGSLDSFESFDVTPIIGREFPNANLKDFLRAPNSDDLIRELALTSELHPWL